MSEFLDVAILAAREAGEVLREKLGRVGFQEKNPADLVTEADVAAQRKTEEILLGTFPTHYLCGEESQGHTPSFGEKFETHVKNRYLTEAQCGSLAPSDKPYTWIVDPLDGTTNFVHGVPFFCVSIALARGNELLCAAMYNPCMNELFTAEQGNGAYLNGARIHTSSVSRANQALTTVSFPTQTRSDSPDYIAFQRCLPICQAIRRTGSTALNLAYVAAGRFDAKLGESGHAWDVAAGALLVLEAGGVVTHSNGRPYDLASRPMLATANSELHSAFLKILND